MYDAEDVLELLNYHNQEYTLDHLAEILKLSALGEPEDPENELKERNMTVWKFTEGSRVTEAGIGVFEDNNWSGQRVPTT
jgi:hypothetical protein